MLLVSPKEKEILEAAKTLNAKEGESILILVGENTSIDIKHLTNLFNQNNIKFCGSIFPSVLQGSQKYEDAVILNKYALVCPPVLVEHLDTDTFEMPDLKNIPLTGDKKHIAMVWVDGLTANIAQFLGKLYKQLGNEVNYIGGGGGSLSLKPSPCLFTNDGFYQDAALVMVVEMEAGLGVLHGWEKIDTPIVTTKTSRNLVEELNWENAFEVYKNVIFEDSGLVITQENFFEIAKSYPFGIFKEGQESLARVAVNITPDGTLTCLGEVPENAVVYILKAKKEALVACAVKAGLESKHNSNNRNLKSVFVVDCISRVLFLEEAVTAELSGISDAFEDIVPEGVLSLGEISSAGNGVLEFFNKTVVVAALS